MSLSYKDSVRNSRLDSLTSALGTAAFLEVFTGSAPGKTTGAFNSDTGTKLASLACSNPTGPGAASGALTFSAITSGTGLASGTPGYFRFKTASSGGTATVIVEGDAAIGSGSLNFASSVALSGTVSITSAVVTEGNS